MNPLHSAWMLFGANKAKGANPSVTPTPYPTPVETGLEQEAPMPAMTPSGIPSYLASEQEFQAAQAPLLSPESGVMAPVDMQDLALESAMMSSAPGGMYSGGSTYFSPTGEESDLMKEVQASIDKQKGIASGYENELANMKRPEGWLAMDLSPAAALVDSWTGSKLLPGYKGPTGAQRHDAHKEKLQAALQRAQGGVTNDQMQLLRMKSDERSKREAAAARAEMQRHLMDYRDKRVEKMDDRFTAQQHQAFAGDKQLSNYEVRLDRIDAAYDLLENPPQGKITSQMIKEISDDIGSALRGSANMAESAREKMEYNTLAGDLAAIASRLSNNPQHVDAPKLVKHLQGQLKRIKYSFTHAMAERAKRIGSQRNFRSSEANDAIKREMNYYNERMSAAKADADVHSKPKATMNPNLLKDLGLE